MKFCFHLLHLNPYEPPNCKLPNFRPCSSEKSPPTHHHSPQMIPDRCVCSVVYTLSSIYLSKGWHIQPLSQAGGEYKAVGDLCEGHRARSLKDQVEQERSSRILEGKSMGLPEAGWNNEMPAQQGHGLGRPSLCCGTYRTWCTFSTIIELTWTRGARSILSINEWSSNVYISTLIRHIHCDWCTHENFSGWWIWILYIYIYIPGLGPWNLYWIQGIKTWRSMHPQVRTIDLHDIFSTVLFLWHHQVNWLRVSHMKVI